MQPELEKLARHRLSRAKHAFNDGEHLFSMDSLEGAVNRFYYTAFHSNVSSLMRNRAEGFSVGRLMEFLTALRPDVQISVRKMQRLQRSFIFPLPVT